MRRSSIGPAIALGVMIAAAAWASPPANAETSDPVEEVVVRGRARGVAVHPGPTSVVTPEELGGVNAVTTEDLVKHEPGLGVRRRFIGDPNATLGIRGSSMFQTARSMVFADGLPLHYLLETRYDGAPRWSLVGPDEIASVQVAYGPFSAEYSGNSMGGVVEIETREPPARRFRVESSLFGQRFDEAGFDHALGGSKVFVSYADRFDDATVYVSYSRLDNDSQPLEYLLARPEPAAGDEIAVDGTLAAVDEHGTPVRYFGNTGSRRVAAELAKARVGFDGRAWRGSTTLAYERRSGDRTAVENYLLDELGRPVFSGRVVDGTGAAFTLRGDEFVVDLERRTSLLVGGRIEGALGERWRLEATASRFDVLNDETWTSSRHPADPAHTPTGAVTAYDDTGWRTIEVQLRNDRLLGEDRLELVTGLSRERYGLRIDRYESADYASGARTSLAMSSGGTTSVAAAYAQVRRGIGFKWDVVLGARLERWSSDDGFVAERAAGPLERLADREEERVSPKLTIGFEPGPGWRLALSLAKAYRFPIVQELFHNERGTTGTSIADATLEPEDGSHANLLLARVAGDGELRLNLFGETIEDVIFEQTAFVDNLRIRTFLPIDRVATRGADVAYRRAGLLGRVDVRFNATYVDSRIEENRVDPSIEGNVLPRMPDWRAHLLVTYHATPRWDLGAGLRYAARSFGDLDNSDTTPHVFGAHDEYAQLDLRGTFRVGTRAALHVGVDNVTDEIAYVHHPWPGRTWFLEASLDWGAER
ncbi:MAG TPA: TonB-dependent receptor [Gammaproteobacteria bacterium]